MKTLLRWFVWLIIPVGLLSFGTYKSYKEKKRNHFQTAGAVIGALAALGLYFFG